MISGASEMVGPQGVDVDIEDAHGCIVRLVNGVGRVLGTDDATPLEFWVALGLEHHLQLDDVVAVDRELPNGDKIKLH